MGIPSFYGRWIVQHSRNPMNKIQILLKQVPSDVSSFSIDMNGLIHEAAQKTFAYGKYADPRRLPILARMTAFELQQMLFSNITNDLLQLVTQTQPKNLLVLAIDGVVPRAKINQQRSRRFKSAKSSERSSIFDSNSITPGTELMIALDRYLVNWLLQNQNLLPPRVLYSSHLVPGEGEHKIMDFMRDGQYPEGPGVNLLYGLDADLIMLSLLSPVNKIYLVRENLRDIISIDAMKLLVRNEMGSTPTAIPDFVLLSFLIGNDFLPHSPSMEDLENSFDDILRLYREAQIWPLTSGLDIVWDKFTQFMQFVANEEPTMLTREAKRSIGHPSPFLREALNQKSRFVQSKSTIEQVLQEQTSFDYDLFRDLWYTNALGPKGNTDVAAKWGLDISPITVDRISDMTREYLTGLAWTFRYYQRNWRGAQTNWYYPYYHTPLFGDVYDYLVNISEPITGHLPDQLPTAYTPVDQLLAVLPRSSIDLVPVEAQPLMAESSIIIDQYPEDFIVELYGKNKDHEGVAILPFADMQRIMEAVETIIFSPERASEFDERTTEEISLTSDEREISQSRQAMQRFVNSQYNRGRGRGANRGANRGTFRGSNRGANNSNTGRFQPRDQEPRTTNSSHASDRGTSRGSRGTRGTNRGTNRGSSRGSNRGNPPSWRSASVLNP